MRNKLLLLSLVLAIGVARAAEIRGKVVNQTTGEALSNVSIMIEPGVRTGTSSDGSFLLRGVPAGKYTLRIDAVGFWFHRMAVEVSEPDVKEFSIALTPLGGRRRETVDVQASAFDVDGESQPSEMTLTTSELKQSDTVLGSDLFRGLQALPGITANTNNDLFAQPRVLGAAFGTVATYIDDVLVQQPFQGIGVHSNVIANELEGGSLGILGDETVESVALTPVAYSQRYAEGIGGALDIHTRVGSRTARPLFSVGVGMAESHMAAEGGIGQNRGSWLISTRKSYLGYLLRRNGAASSLEPSFSDLDLRLTHDLTKHQSLDLSAIAGGSTLHNSFDLPAADKIYKGNSDFSLARLAWRMEATPDLLFSLRAAYTSSGDSTENQFANPLRDNNSAEWVAGGTTVWNWRPRQSAEAGWTFRRITNSYREYGYSQYGDLYGFWGRAGVGERQGGYLQQSLTLFGQRLALVGGIRYDQYSEADLHPVSPQLSGSLRVLPSTYLLFGTGRYVQFDTPSTVAVACGAEAPLVNTSDHYSTGIEQRLSDNLRIRVQAFARMDRQHDGIRGGDDMLGEPSAPTSCGPVMESRLPLLDWHGRTQGLEFTLQKRTSNRLSGWISYTYMRQVSDYWSGDLEDGMTTWWKSRTIAGAGDQKHTVNLFGTYRVRPSLIASAKLLYGSGYPIPGSYGYPWLVYIDGHYDEKSRMDSFFRVDVRADKAIHLREQKVTLHGEILNVTNHHNMRFVGSQYLYVNQQLVGSVMAEERSLGFTPAAGIDFQF